MFLYETQRYSSNEIFGNILGNDLKDLNEELKVRRKKYRKPKELVRRRGYKDHGARRPDDRWLPSHDVSFTEEQLLKEKKTDLFISTTNYLLKYLENKRLKEETKEN
jgi:hypothetical protein